MGAPKPPLWRPFGAPPLELAPGLEATPFRPPSESQVGEGSRQRPRDGAQEMRRPAPRATEELIMRVWLQILREKHPGTEWVPVATATSSGDQPLPAQCTPAAVAA